MVAQSLTAFRPELRRHEGGYSNHPADPGKATNIGITQRVYDDYRQGVGLADRNVRDITNLEVETIYRERYWDVIRGDELPAGVDTCTMDGAVNSGPGQSAKWLQRQMGVTADGGIGPITLKAANDYPNKPVLIKGCSARRLRMMMSLGHWETFKGGWTRRVAEVEAFSVTLALKAVERSPESIRAVNLDEAATADRSRKRNNNAAGTTGAATAADGVVVTDQVVDPGSAPDAATELLVDAVWLDLLLGGLLIVGVLGFAYFLWRAFAQKQRRDAYRLASSGGLE